MDAPVRLKHVLLRAAGVAFGLATQVLFLVTVCFLFLFLRDGSSRLAPNWLVVDAGLTAQFAIAHSWLLRPQTRSLIARYVPAQFYGSIFATATCLGLWLMFAFWQASSTVVWEANGWTRIGVSAGFYTSWVTLFYSLKLTGFGYQTGWTQWLCWLRGQPLPRRAFVERGIYAWMRHPVYLSFLGLIWFTPRMTADHAVLTVGWTAYIFVGSYLKDQRLLFYLPDKYHEYGSRVRGYPGMFCGPLGMWPARPAKSSTDETATDAVQRRVA